jgi:hypothetical protein
MKKLLSAVLFGLWALTLFAQPEAPDPEDGKFTISGYVKDASTGEELIYATVTDLKSGEGATTNLYGFYSLSLPEGEYNLEFAYLGYETLTRKVSLKSSLELNIELPILSNQLQEVTVTDESERESVERVAMSRIDIEIEELKKMPALLGEPDVIKTVQTLPGVTSAGEGTSAFFVRGGSADQNLVLIDEAPVYDVSHLFGLFSVFNADIVKSAELYKGGIPAKYGGRLSSLLEVTTRDGNAKRFSGSGGIGLLAAKLSLEGPIVEDEMSFIVSARRSYADIFMNASDDIDASVAFHDYNAKLNWKKDNYNRFFLSVYSGRDVWTFGDNFQMDWGNQTASFRWNHLFSDKMFSNLTLVYSDFDYALEDTDEADGLSWRANQREISLKEDVSWFVNPNLSVQFGYQGIYRRFTPGVIRPNSPESIFKETRLPKNFALEHGLYAGADWQLSDRLSVQAGVRLSAFQHMGSATIYEYADPENTENIEVIDSTMYNSWEVVKSYFNPEPRFAARYLLGEDNSMKFSYNRMVQYVHLLSNSTVPIPFNTWAPSSVYLEPQIADQVALGYFHTLDKGMYDFSMEAFYKKSTGITGFADNAHLFFNPHLSTEFRQGEGEAYGLEFFVQKNKGDVRGFVSYTLSKAETSIPTVNNDEVFPANHDRRHNLNMALVYDFSRLWSLGANFTYATGRPITLPAGKYEYDGYQVNLYTERNAYRLPDFHRLDLSATFEPGKLKDKRFKSTFSFGLYNAYNRKNPFTIYTRVKQDDDGNIIGDGTEKEARLVYLFGALPYFNWNFSF